MGYILNLKNKNKASIERIPIPALVLILLIFGLSPGREKRQPEPVAVFSPEINENYKLNYYFPCLDLSVFFAPWSHSHPHLLSLSPAG